MNSDPDAYGIVEWEVPRGTPWVNSTPVECQEPVLGDPAIEEWLAPSMRQTCWRWWGAPTKRMARSAATAIHASAADLFEIPTSGPVNHRKAAHRQ